mmetsp:Transcript_67112/g.184079  ORF Transcript_67112/g.184079 Transcript_67112/m.184079 type:complete len:192 (+) Transcript_67112:303-878(+)
MDRPVLPARSRRRGWLGPRESAACVVPARWRASSLSGAASCLACAAHSSTRPRISTEKAKMAPRVIELHTELDFASGDAQRQDDVVEVLVQLGLNDRRAIDRFLPKAFGFAVLVLLALILVASSAGLAARLIGGLLVGVESCALACSAQDVAGARCVPVACPVAVPAFLSLLGCCNVPPVRVVPSTVSTRD